MQENRILQNWFLAKLIRVSGLLLLLGIGGWDTALSNSIFTTISLTFMYFFTKYNACLQLPLVQNWEYKFTVEQIFWRHCVVSSESLTGMTICVWHKSDHFRVIVCVRLFKAVLFKCPLCMIGCVNIPVLTRGELLNSYKNLLKSVTSHWLRRVKGNNGTGAEPEKSVLIRTAVRVKLSWIVAFYYQNANRLTFRLNSSLICNSY